jgi:hypothetical protein
MLGMNSIAALANLKSECWANFAPEQIIIGQGPRV